jgi:hypothetical protein
MVSGFTKDYLSQATNAFDKALDSNSGGIATGRGDQAQAAQIAALIAVAQRLDAILEVLRTLPVANQPM